MALPRGIPEEGLEPGEEVRRAIEEAKAAERAMIGTVREVKEEESLRVYTGGETETSDLEGLRSVLATLEGGDRFEIASFGEGTGIKGTPQEIVYVKLVTHKPGATGYMLRFEMGSKSERVDSQEEST